MSPVSLTFSRPGSLRHFKFLNGGKMRRAAVDQWVTGLLAASVLTDCSVSRGVMSCDQLEELKQISPRNFQWPEVPLVSSLCFLCCIVTKQLITEKKSRDNERIPSGRGDAVNHSLFLCYCISGRASDTVLITHLLITGNNQTAG